MATVKVSDSSFKTDVIDSDTPVLVDFWAEWCGPCKQIGPALEQISDEMGDKIKVAKVNIDDDPETPAKGDDKNKTHRMGRRTRLDVDTRSNALKPSAKTEGFFVCAL